MARGLFGCGVVLVLVTTSLLGPPALAVDPITAGIVSGLSVAILQGIATTVAGDGDAQVHCEVQLTGPDGDDKAVSDPTNDNNDIWFGLESDLDCDVDISAPNGGEDHLGWAELHWHWDDDAWRPNLDDYLDKNDLDGYVWTRVVMEKDTTPVAGNTGSTICPGANATCGAAVAVFATEGQIKETFKEEEGEIVSRAGGGRERAGFSDSGFATEPISVSGFSTLYFTPEALQFVESGDAVTITPLFGEVTVDVMHSTAAVNTSPTVPPSAPPALLSPHYLGLDQTGSGLVEDVMLAMASESAHVTFSSSAQAPLTIHGAALSFRSLTVDRFDAGGQERDPFDLLEEYFRSTAAVAVVAPSQAQSGYVPSVTHREVVIGSNPISGSGVDPEIRGAIPAAVIEGTDPFGNQFAAATPLIGLLIGVEGSLLDAVNLSADTTGTPLNSLLGGLAPGEEFDLDFTVSSSSMVYAGSMEEVLGPLPIPAVSEWGLVIMTVLLLTLLGATVLRRRAV